MLPPAEEIQIVLLIFSILFLVLTFKHTIYGVISYFIILNTRLGGLYPALGAIRIELIAAVVVFVSIFLKSKGLENLLPQKNDINKAAYVLFFVGMASVLVALNISVSWKLGGYELLKLTLFYVMTVASIHEEKDLKKLVWAFVLVTAWTAYEPVVNFLRGSVQDFGYGAIGYGRFGAAAGHVALANTLNQGIPLTYFLALYEERKARKLLLWLLLALMAFGVVMSRSRGGFLGLLFVLSGIAYLARKKRKTLVVLGTVFVLFVLYAGPSYVKRMSTITHGINQDRTTKDRLWGLIHGITMMTKRPVLGVGIGGYAAARRHYFSYYLYAHNLYGELFGELGLASVAWFYFIFLVLREIRELRGRFQHEDNTHNFYFNVLNGIQLGLFVRLFVGLFSHCALIWFWFSMAALTVGIQNVLVQKNNEIEP